MKTIPMQPVASSNISAVGHDPDTNTMAVEFKSGGVYHYPNTTADEVAALQSAESVGAHFHRYHRHRFSVKQ